MRSDCTSRRGRGRRQGRWWGYQRRFVEFTWSNCSRGVKRHDNQHCDDHDVKCHRAEPLQRAPARLLCRGHLEQSIQKNVVFRRRSETERSCSLSSRCVLHGTKDRNLMNGHNFLPKRRANRFAHRLLECELAFCACEPRCLAARTRLRPSPTS